MSYDEAVVRIIWNTRMELMQQNFDDGASREEAEAMVEGLVDEEILAMVREKVESLSPKDNEDFPFVVNPFSVFDFEGEEAL